ncbi:MAG: ribonuclease J [Clostridia bacterium]|nr:ribonuclease J [Deltaproteobacteria bacterium]
MQIGEFSIEPIPVTHSIADAVALAITTSIGTVIHTGDFKLDPTPIDGRLTDLKRFRELGDRGVIALLSDSTNAEKPGRTWSELSVANAMREHIGKAPNRVCVTTFSSNIHRVQSIIDASYAVGRTVIPVGRSVVQNIQMSLERGFLKVERGALAEPSYYDNIPRSHVTVIASGSQGEAQASMTRIAKATHPYIRLDPEDRVIWSSRRIPGNELAIGSVTGNLLRAGIELLDDRVPHVHTSGHAFADELGDIISAVRPRFFVPVHGELRHMRAHAKIAEGLGVEPANIFIVEDGQPLVITDTPQGSLMRRDEPVHTGHIFIEGDGLNRVDEVVLRDRNILAETGIVVVVAVVDDIGALVSGPEIATRGVIHVDANAGMMNALRDEVTAALDTGELERGDDALAEDMRLAVRRFFRRELGKKPIVVPLVMRV